MSEALDHSRMRRLLEVGRAVLGELDSESVLDRVLETAKELTGARFAALGVLDVHRAQLERFITLGIDEQTRRALGDPPRGRGVLGVLIDEPRPLRLQDVGQHPRSYGFPAGHPKMHSFLGVPVLIRGQAWGNLYLTEKRSGDFDEADEQAVVILAEWAAIAIENARLYQISEVRRVELEKALRGAEATRDIAVAIGGDLELERVLDLIVKRGRALVEARSMVIMLREGGELVVVASAGYAQGVKGLRLREQESPYGHAMKRGRPERIGDVAARMGIASEQFGVANARSALIVPLLYRSAAMGVLIAFDRGEDRDVFSEEDGRVLNTFAASAATAVTMAQSVQEERLRHALEAADEERRRWARELHDQTLQGLAGVRVLLSAALRRGADEHLQAATREAVTQIEHEIASLRAIIADLRPAALDELGLASALCSLVERHREADALSIDAQIALEAGERAGLRLTPELETTIYRLVQEALTNVSRHAHARRVQVTVGEDAGEISVEVRDDGIGLAQEAAGEGLGITGMRERARLAGGSLAIDGTSGGTRLRARFPARWLDDSKAASSSSSDVEQAVS